MKTITFLLFCFFNINVNAQIYNKNIIYQYDYSVEEDSISKKREIYLGCLGLTFKQDVDDTRESPAYLIVKKLIEEKFNVIPCDPNIKKNVGFKLFTIEETINRSDLIIILVTHKEFRKLNLENVNFIDFSGFY